MQALDVSNPYDKTGMGVLSVRYKKPLVIEKETWPTVLSYVLAQTLCSDTYRTILRNHKSGFSIFRAEKLSAPRNPQSKSTHTLSQHQKTLDKLIDQWRQIKDEEDDENEIAKKEREISSVIDSFDPEIKKRFLGEVIDPLKLQLEMFKKDIQEARVITTLLTQWDVRSGELKNNLADFSKAVDFLPSRFTTASAKDIWMPPGGVIVDLDDYMKAREAVRKEAQDQAIAQSKSAKGPKKVPIEIYRAIMEQMMQDPQLLSKALKNQGVKGFIFPSLEDNDVRDNLIQNLNELVTKLEDAIIPLEDYINLTTRLGRVAKKKISSDELFELWQDLSVDEKRGYFRPIMPVFQDLLFRCRLERTNVFLNQVYEVVLRDPIYSEFLMSTSENDNPRNLIYIDPFDQTAPLLGVGVVRERFIGSNNVGKVLEQQRSTLKRLKRDKEKDELLKETKQKRREFYIAYSQLRRLLRSRDIPEFVDKTIPEILRTLTTHIVVNTPKRSYILYDVNLPDEIGEDIPDEIRVAIARSGLDIDLNDPDTSWMQPPDKKFPDYPESLISYSFDQNRDFINDYFVYEQKQPGNLANFLRHQYLEDLYDRQVYLEKVAYLRGFLTYLFLADPQSRIEKDKIAVVVDHEMANMHSILKIATEIDNIVQLDEEEVESGFKDLFDRAYPGLDIPLTITDGDDEIGISTFLENFVDDQRKRGELPERVSTATKNKAKAWQMKKHLAKTKDVVRKLPKNTDLQDLNLKDRLIAATLSSGDTTDVLPYTPDPMVNTEEIVAPLSKEITPVPGFGDIIFSSDSRQGGITDFPLSPTENLQRPVIINYFLFPTPLHAVCFLWLSKETGLNQDEAFLRLLKPEWIATVNDMGLFPNREEDKRAMYPIDRFIEPLARRDNRLAEILSGIILENVPAQDVSIPIVLHHLFYLKASDAFLPWQDCWLVTMHELNQRLISIMKTSLEKAHSVKFDDAEIVKKLLLTGESHLVNFDRRDSILGARREKGGSLIGLNLVGDDLMRLRQKLLSETDIKPISFSEEELLKMVEILSTRMMTFKNLISAIYKSLLFTGTETETYILSIKLARGIVSLYQMHCGHGLQPPFSLTNRLQPVAKSFEDLIPKTQTNNLSHQTSNLIWSFVKVIFACTHEGKTMDWEKVNNVSDSCKKRAEKLIAIFMDCLIRKFGARKYLSKIPDLVKAIVDDNVGRTAYIGSINFKEMPEHQLRDIVEGKLDYREFHMIPPTPEVVDCDK